MTVHAKRLLGLLTAIALSLTLLGGSAAGAAAPGESTPEDPADGFLTTHGFYNPAANPTTAYVRLIPRCRAGRDDQIFVGVTTRMWSNGARINGFHFKTRLVSQGSEGQPVLTAWTDNSTFSFTSGGPQERTIGRNTPYADSTADWDVEVKMKFPRDGTRVDYRYKFRVPFTEPDCLPLPSF